MSGIRIERDERRPAVLQVVLDRPEVRNAQTPAMWRELAAAGEQLADDIRVVVVRGEGPGFSAGLDRALLTPEGLDGESLLAVASSGPDAARAFIAEAQHAFAWLPECGAVTIAAVHGHAIGAGFQLALACDIVVAGESAQFAMRETSLGIVPDLGGTWPLVRSIGFGPALEACATGRTIPAQEAVARGLAVRVVPDDALAADVDTLVDAILAAPDGAVRELKRLLREAEGSGRIQQATHEQDAQLRRFADMLGGR